MGHDFRSILTESCQAAHPINHLYYLPLCQVLAHAALSRFLSYSVSLYVVYPSTVPLHCISLSLVSLLTPSFSSSSHSLILFLFRAFSSWAEISNHFQLSQPLHLEILATPTKAFNPQSLRGHGKRRGVKWKSVAFVAPSLSFSVCSCIFNFSFVPLLRASIISLCKVHHYPECVYVSAFSVYLYDHDEIWWCWCVCLRENGIPHRWNLYVLDAERRERCVWLRKWSTEIPFIIV